MISKARAVKAATKLPFPRKGEVVRVSSIEVLDAYFKLHGVQEVKWNGDLLVIVRRGASPVVAKVEGSSQSSS